MQYYVPVLNSDTEISVTASLTSDVSTATVNGTSLLSGATSINYALNVWNNTIFINVVSENGASTTYTIVVFRAPCTLFYFFFSPK